MTLFQESGGALISGKIFSFPEAWIEIPRMTGRCISCIEIAHLNKAIYDLAIFGATIEAITIRPMFKF